ncbi:hypothetical protein [Gemmobacter nectariphilus]|uniref:hypothetical protein n=1 Tax=Gemmobacter nectariphilus TaxID=220343 RepID=UPI0013765B60|nr:hypothetical protein [Gemmobacter nectariphilus]
MVLHTAPAASGRQKNAILSPAVRLVQAGGAIWAQQDRRPEGPIPATDRHGFGQQRQPNGCIT